MRKPKFLVPVLVIATGLALAGCIRSKEKLYDESKALTPFKGKLVAVRMSNDGSVRVSQSTGRVTRETFELRGKVYSHTVKKQEFTVHAFPGRENFFILQVTQPRRGQPAHYYVAAYRRGPHLYTMLVQGGRATQRVVKAGGVNFELNPKERNNMFFASAADVAKAYDAIIKSYANRSRRLNWTRYYVATTDEEKAELKKKMDAAMAKWKASRAMWSKGEPE